MEGEAYHPSFEEYGFSSKDYENLPQSEKRWAHLDVHTHFTNKKKSLCLIINKNII